MSTEWLVQCLNAAYLVLNVNEVDDLKKLQQTVSTIKAVLLDAEEKQAHSREISTWLEDLKDVLLDAEDLLNEFECEALKKKVEKLHGNTCKKVRGFFSRSNPIAFRLRVGHTLMEIRERLDEIAANKARFHLNERSEEKQTIYRRRAMDQYSFLHAPGVIGREVDKVNILNLLMDPCDDTNLSIIPICGIGGLGKTTLAKLVYNDRSVTSHFELKMWVCLSEDFELPRIIKDILDSATKEISHNLTLDQMHDCLRDKLKDKRFLLVLDDVWNDSPNKWFPLRDLLKEGSIRGSKIIVTTRKCSVANLMGTSLTYDLSGLSAKDCWSLFTKWAFREEDGTQYQNLKTIGRQIVERCRGIPLAVTTLGSLLHSNLDEQDWKNVRDSEIWKLNQTEDQILPALKLSYNELPPYLKQCFHYCSLFPKGYTFKSDELYQLWLAHGVFQPHDHGNKSLEDVCHSCFKELWSRSFFQDVQETEVSRYRFYMHDLIHDLALSVSQSEFLMISSATQSISQPRLRHLSFTYYSDAGPTGLEKLNGVRTIIFPIRHGPSNTSFMENNFSKFKSLWILNLRYSKLESLPSCIGSMKHLRCLDLSFSKSIKKLPKSICKLHSLQTLRLFGCVNLEGLPREINCLISLRYLEVTTAATCFPGMECLISLRRLEIYHCNNLISLPQSLKSLTSLEALEICYCKKLILTEEEDDQVTKLSLRRLLFRGLPEMAALPQWLRGCEDNLQLLLFNGCPNFGELPMWLTNMTSLENLVIWGCPKLESLPEGMQGLYCLRELSIGLSPKLKIFIKEMREVDRPPNVPIEAYI
ncbi:NB-ARC domain, LRR domain containing protein [Trema orientale]|uniref:NB-ARC domain, LRR domain containing protein n=1 Tax=Trema orientale TaxID=63057 RepID=A0A2P5EW64_TREOI|nr:NB-ARC domain, LRR domain containing protein [Trema orientale]